MALNKNYGDLNSSGSIVYAPRSFLEDGALFVPRIDDDEAYLVRGWFKVVNVKPDYDVVTQIIYIKKWVKDAEAGTVTAEYEVTARPEDSRKKAKKYSKLKMTMFLIEQKLWDDVKAYLEKIGYYDLFVMAQYFLDTDDYYQTGIDMFKKAYASDEHPIEELNDLVTAMENFAFDGYEILAEEDPEKPDETTTASNAGL